MSIIHFLNVLEGDCNIIQHDGEKRLTVIDVSNAYNDVDTEMEKNARESIIRQLRKNRTGVPSDKKDYGQKKIPDNPIDYIKKLNETSIHRFIITHPDMDHLDGIKDLYTEFNPTNTWDTNNNKEIPDNQSFAGYNKEDWEFYLSIRDGAYSDTSRRTYTAGIEREYFTDDHLTILCPTNDLVNGANESTGDYHDASYVLLYTPPKKGGGHWKIIFGGDSFNNSWDYIMENFEDEVKDTDILFAPHHGRDSNRKWDFLKVVNPKVILFGNAKSGHLAYNNYNTGVRITNNQAGYVVINITDELLEFYVKHKDFAEHFTNNKKRGRDWGTRYVKEFDGYYLGALEA